MFIRKMKHLAIALTIALSGSVVLMPAMASASFASDACSGVQAVAGGGATTATGCPKGGTNQIGNVIKLVINILSGIVGFAAVLMIILGGFKFITAGGDSSSIASARSTILYAIIGLVIVALAQVLVHFVLFQANNAAAPCKPSKTVVCQ